MGGTRTRAPQSRPRSVAMTAQQDIPVSVFTGFLGAGKTTIILSLLKQLPKDYKVVLLKNEFGDVEVDSQLAKESAVEAVSEILNGCMCCVLVGQMRTALLEIKDKFAPDRIIIESSGSAFPATLAWQVRQLEDEGLKLDSVVTVIDCLNFTGYEDTSPTAKMQAKYTDLLLLNKHELASERQLDNVLDSLYELNTETPKLKISRTEPPKPDLIFGLLSVPGAASKESKVFGMVSQEEQDKLSDPASANGGHADKDGGEVETLNIWRGGQQPGHAGHTHVDGLAHDHKDASGEERQDGDAAASEQTLTKEKLDTLLGKLPSEDVWRVKGFLKLENSGPSPYSILNWAFGRYELHEASAEMSKKLEQEGVEVRLTVMGARGEVKRRATILGEGLGSRVS